MEGYIKERIEILKQLYIWRKLSPEEKKIFKGCTTEIQVDRYMRHFRNKYL